MQMRSGAWQSRLTGWPMRQCGCSNITASARGCLLKDREMNFANFHFCTEGYCAAPSQWRRTVAGTGQNLDKTPCGCATLLWWDRWRCALGQRLIRLFEFRQGRQLNKCNTLSANAYTALVDGYLRVRHNEPVLAMTNTSPL